MSAQIPIINEDIDELRELVKLRRTFHQYPEPGFTEYVTTCRICELLDQRGYHLTYGKALYEAAYPGIQHISEIVTIDAQRVDETYQLAQEQLQGNQWLKAMQGGFTGVIAERTCSDDGPTIGFRFDIDGLALQESSDVSHTPQKAGFRSQNDNMHACAHDGHLTIGLGLAKRIQEQAATLAGKYVLIFQPAEEGPSGGNVFSHFDLFQHLDYLIPLHIGIINERKIVCGLSFLAQKGLHVTFEGVNTHAAAHPERGKNALLAACQAVSGLYGIARHSAGMSRMNVGKFRSENPVNVISNLAQFELEVRGETDPICDYVYDRATEIIQGAAAMHGVKVTIKDVGEYVAAENSPAVMALLHQAARKAGIPDEAIIEHQLVPGSEDATFLMNAVRKHGGKASYVCLGSPIYGGHHNARFDFDEDVLLWGVRMLWEFIKSVQPAQRANGQ